MCEGQGQGAGGRGEDHLCGAPLGFPLPLTHEVTHLQTVGGEGTRGYSTGNTIYTIALVGR